MKGDFQKDHINSVMFSISGDHLNKTGLDGDFNHQEDAAPGKSRFKVFQVECIKHLQSHNDNLCSDHYK